VIVRFGRSDERIYTGRKADRSYRPDPAAAQATRSLASVVDGRAYSESDASRALAAARLLLGRGPLADVGQGLHVVALARWLALAGLVPLFFLLWQRDLA
jgi:hypothetical protein